MSLFSRDHSSAEVERGFFASSSFPNAASDRVAMLNTEPNNPDLAPCPGCGAQNGRSALVCWNCEASLAGAAGFLNAKAESPATRSDPAESPLPARPPEPPVAAARQTDPVGTASHPFLTRPSELAQVPVLTAEVGVAPSAATPPGFMAAGRRTGPGLWSGLAIGVLLLTGGYWLFEPVLAPVMSPGAARSAAPARSDDLPARVATPLPEISHPAPAIAPLPEASAESPTLAAVRPATAPAPSKVSRKVTPLPAPPVRTGRRSVGPAVNTVVTGTSGPPAPARAARDPQRASPEISALGLPVEPRPAVPPAPRAATGDCTTTLAALGLCTGPFKPAKER